jgi:anti-sigma regulatory factor (Ser/Thr protein kinase)
MAGGFCHEALLHSGDEGFLAAAVPFVRSGLGTGERVMVALTPGKLRLLRAALGDDAAAVAFADMTELGANPGRIIPAWHDFLDGDGGAPARGIGEPVWPSRTTAELVECHRHEALQNVAFVGAAAFTLMCPYDTTVFGEGLLAHVRRNHPVLVEDGVRREGHGYAEPHERARRFDDPLPDPARRPDELDFGLAELGATRRLVWDRARRAGLRPPRDEDLVLAVNELATNSVRHGGGHGTLRVWRESGALICEVRDHGHIEDPLAGRRRPDRGRDGGYGLWLANQVCDLVQMRATPDGSVTRVHMRTA